MATNNPAKQKVLLLGRSGSGKTSIRSMIFANFRARDTSRLGPTLDVENSNVRFLGKLVLNLWDCGGQDRFMENYFHSQRDHIFRNVSVLVFVFDIRSADNAKDLQYFDTCLAALADYSPDAHIFVFVHKMDLAPSQLERERLFARYSDAIAHRTQRHEERLRSALIFGTSIWDETLYLAWSQIVRALIPNVEDLEDALGTLCEACRATEVVLFERATFLVVARHSRRKHKDAHRFEKISNIVKQFKLSCLRMGMGHSVSRTCSSCRISH
ncbi:MAG: hypothetical protein MHM6MM_007137 [Cercozoa sp. M6MM]